MSPPKRSLERQLIPPPPINCIWGAPTSIHMGGIGDRPMYQDNGITRPTITELIPYVVFLAPIRVSLLGFIILMTQNHRILYGHKVVWYAWRDSNPRPTD